MRRATYRQARGGGGRAATALTLLIAAAGLAVPGAAFADRITVSSTIGGITCDLDSWIRYRETLLVGNPDTVHSYVGPRCYGDPGSLSLLRAWGGTYLHQVTGGTFGGDRIVASAEGGISNWGNLRAEYLLGNHPFEIYHSNGNITVAVRNYKQRNGFWNYTSAPGDCTFYDDPAGAAVWCRELNDTLHDGDIE